MFCSFELFENPKTQMFKHLSFLLFDAFEQKKFLKCLNFSKTTLCHMLHGRHLIVSKHKLGGIAQ